MSWKNHSECYYSTFQYQIYFGAYYFTTFCAIKVPCNLYFMLGSQPCVFDLWPGLVFKAETSMQAVSVKQMQERHGVKGVALALVRLVSSGLLIKKSLL